jgi:hypothetical protein
MFHSAIDGAIFRKTIWAGPAGFDDGELLPEVPGTPQTAYVVFTESLPQEGALFVSRVSAGGTVGEPQYLGHMATFTREDTLSGWWDGRLRGWAPPQLFPGRSWYWTGVARLGHDAGAARIVTQSAVQWEMRARICELYGYYGMAGERAPCE